ncbi:MAG: hypothetical protein ACPG47_05150 [Leucothrix sp.]
MPTSPYTLQFTVATYIKILAAISLILVGTHIGLYCYHYQVDKLPWLLRQLFDLDEENNLPTWFSHFLLLNNAFILLLIANTAREKTFYWWSLAVGFLILSIDEVAGLHETFHSTIDINWAIPAGVLVAIVGVFFIPFLKSLERRVAVLFLISGAIFVSGALIIELLSEDLKTKSLEYAFATALEEGMEMTGALLFLSVNLNLIKTGSQVELGTYAH